MRPQVRILSLRPKTNGTVYRPVCFCLQITYRTVGSEGDGRLAPRTLPQQLNLPQARFRILSLRPKNNRGKCLCYFLLEMRLSDLRPHEVSNHIGAMGSKKKRLSIVFSQRNRLKQGAEGSESPSNARRLCDGGGQSRFESCHSDHIECS